MRKEVLSIFILNFTLLHGLTPLDNPYEILGVKKTSTVEELRKAYKKLVKEWHPDKNDDPSAESKFVDIKQAYELLSDPERRKQYDTHGTIDPDATPKNKQDFRFDEFDPFEDFFDFPYKFRFSSHNPDVSFFHKTSITARAFENNLLPKSHISPQLVLFYSDWCYGCSKVEPIWRKLTDELEPIGVGMATVHKGEEQALAKKCGATGVPALVVLINGRIYPYKNSVYSSQKIVDFIRNQLPYKLLEIVNDDNMNAFLEGWHDNKVRALVFQKSEPVRLRYLLMAFHYLERVSFGFVQLDSLDTIEIRGKYRIPAGLDTLLLFNENTVRPAASLSMTVIPVQAMKNVVAENKFLILPRLSSQRVMDSVCPVEWARQKKKLCIVLVSENSKDHEESRREMRHFAQESTYNRERVRFSYIYQERQPEFINSLLEGSSRDTALSVVILWRRDANHVRFEWMEGRWSVAKTSSQWNTTKERLDATIAKLLKTNETLAYGAVFKELVDEHAQGLLGKIVSRFLIAVDIIRDNIGKDDVYAAVSVLGTIFFIIGGGYFMAYLVRKEEEKIKSYGGRTRQGKTSNGSGNGYTPEMKLHELKAEKYNAMVRMLKPGCRSIILIIDDRLGAELLRKFHAMVWPYRKNKTLLFGYMYIDAGLEWYKRLLELSLSQPRELNINPRNCAGTVLSINGHRKYFCMYHAKHPENLRRRRSKDENSDVKDFRFGSILGFDGSSSSEDSYDVEQGERTSKDDIRTSEFLSRSSLLSGLPDWLDRLFEGTTARYHINYWPDFPTK